MVGKRNAVFVCLHSILSSSLQGEKTVDITKCVFTVVDEGSEEDIEEDVYLDSFAQVAAPSDGLDTLTEMVSVDPDALLGPSPEIAEAAKLAVKEVIDYSLMENFKPATASNTMKAGIFVDGFDAEQIWLQLDAITTPALNHIKRVFKKNKDIERVVPEDVEEALDGMLQERYIESLAWFCYVVLVFLFSSHPIYLRMLFIIWWPLLCRDAWSECYRD